MTVGHVMQLVIYLEIKKKRVSAFHAEGSVYAHNKNSYQLRQCRIYLFLAIFFMNHMKFIFSLALRF